MTNNFAVAQRKVKAIYFANYSLAKKDFEKNTGNRQAMKESRLKLTEMRDKEIKAILSEEQKAKYDIVVKELRDQRQKRMKALRSGN